METKNISSIFKFLIQPPIKEIEKAIEVETFNIEVKKTLSASFCKLSHKF